MLPAPCCRCGRLVVPRPGLPNDGWEPDHWPVPREQGGTQVWPAHSRCNRSAGGKRGAQITNARRTNSATTTNRRDHARGIRGV